MGYMDVYVKITCRKFIVNVLILFYPFYTLVSLGLVMWCINLFERAHKMNAILLIIVLLGIIYDNLIISMGCKIGQGNVLKFLNYLRIIFHGLFTPLLVVFAWELLSDFSLETVSNTILPDWSWVIALGLILLNTVENTFELELILEDCAGTLRYKPAKFNAVPSIVTILLTSVVGAYIYLHSHWPWMFVGSILILLGQAIPSKIVGPFVASAAELGFMYAMIATVSMIN